MPTLTSSPSSPSSSQEPPPRQLLAGLGQPTPKIQLLLLIHIICQLSRALRWLWNRKTINSNNIRAGRDFRSVICLLPIRPLNTRTLRPQKRSGLFKVLPFRSESRFPASSLCFLVHVVVQIRYLQFQGSRRPWPTPGIAFQHDSFNWTVLTLERVQNRKWENRERRARGRSTHLSNRY